MENQITGYDSATSLANLLQLKGSSGPVRQVTTKEAEAVSSPVNPEKSKEEVSLRLDQQELAEIQKRFESTFSYRNTSLEISVDQPTQKTIFKIVDNNSGEVIKQFPPEEVLAFAQQLISFLDGRMVNVKV